MIGLKNAVSMRARVMWVRAFMNTYKRRVIAAGGYIEGEQCAIDKINGNNILKEASWRLIPEGIEEDIVFAQKPTDGLGDLQFTRASDATRTNSAGVIERTPWNLATFSEDFSNVAWSKTGITVTSNVEVAPNGTLTADRIVFSSSNRSLSNATSLGTGVVCTGSFYVKGTAGETILMAAGGLDALFTLTGSWQRISTTKTSITSIINVSTFGGATARDIFLWGAQLVEGTDAKPYFATTNRQDVPRLDYRNADGSLNSCPRLLLEPQRTNSIRNSTIVGAVAGSPGTLPTNWTQITIGGLTRTIVGTGTENGLSYVDIRYNGTATGPSTFLGFETFAGITAATGQTWNGSFYVKTIATPAPPSSFRSIIAEFTSLGVYIRDVALIITPTSNLNRFSQTETLAGGATTARVVSGIAGILTIGAAYDFTIRIAAPQMELGAYASTFIPTTTAAVTRLADAASKTGVSSLIGQTEGTLFAEVNLGNFVTNAGVLTISDGTNNNIVSITTFSSNRIRLLVRTGGSGQVAINSSTYTAGNFKIAVAYKASDFAFYVNGVQVAVQLSGIVPLCPNLYVGTTGDGTVNPLSDGIIQAALFPTRLTNAQLAEITTL
jgi:hypothetical protein